MSANLKTVETAFKELWDAGVLLANKEDRRMKGRKIEDVNRAGFAGGWLV